MSIIVNLADEESRRPELIRAFEAGETIVVVETGVPVEWAGATDSASVSFGAHPGLCGPNWDEAFTDEADAEVRAMFDDQNE